MKKYLNYNGRFFADDEAVLPADNRSYRYGDGLFETMKMVNGNIVLANLHFERLMGSLEILKISLPKLITSGMLKKEIIDLYQKNNLVNSARVRLSVSRGNGGLYDGDNEFQYLIECWPLENSAYKLNENGLIIDIFPDARKSCDKFSNLKSANFLAYAMAAIWAKENKLNEALVLNSYERICDATTANIFWVKDNKVFTPPLSEGCVAGVMRRYLLENLQGAGYSFQELESGIDNLEDADEVFLTNAIYGIKWVKQFQGKKYQSIIANEIFNRIAKQVF